MHRCDVDCKLYKVLLQRSKCAKGLPCCVYILEQMAIKAVPGYSGSSCSWKSRISHLCSFCLHLNTTKGEANCTTCQNNFILRLEMPCYGLNFGLYTARVVCMIEMNEP